MQQHEDPRDPDGLLTVEQAADTPSRTVFGHAETDTLDVENHDSEPAPVKAPATNSIGSDDITGG